MAVPRNRHSVARKKTRRSHHAKTARQTMKCAACGADVLPHHACAACGHYKGRIVAAAVTQGESD